ncbi:hypothetical protein POTOM_016046 [Populus tomentosa]|uniref:F-box domain-containing protein n=1 Tax=Populus tomentosa TaxID=118781 RepID=A0A8X8A412_POPTO|nr:hypothetical protein POTOM_016046 [Populus tomentosa]
MLRVSSMYSMKKSRFCRKTSSSKKRDGISALPDEIIIHILSFLTPKDAAITSLLSRRWRNLWTFIPNLNFNVNHMARPDPLMRRRAFVRMVSNVLSLHSGQNINKFWICYELDCRSARYIDKWISFAIERKVENLILDLTEEQEIDVDPEMYTFPCFFFSDEKALSSIKYLRIAGCILHLPPCFNNLKSLVELSLTYVMVTENELNKLLSGCLLLERFSVGNVPKLVNLKVSGPSLRLRVLGNAIIDIYDSTFDYVANICDHLAFNAPQLKSLGLRIVPLEVNTSLTVFPRLVNLKVLTLLVHESYDTALWYLLRASPFLQLLQVKFLWRIKSPLRTGGCKNIFSGYGTAFTHEFLKEVHMFGFRSRLDDIEFARYLLKNATALNILVIDPFIRYLDGWVEKENKATRKARDEARRLLKEAPANVHLLIL